MKTTSESGQRKAFSRLVLFQMLQRVMTVAAESLKVLERQLMDGKQLQDVRVGRELWFDGKC